MSDMQMSLGGHCRSHCVCVACYSLATAYIEQCWGTIVAMKMPMTCARQCQGIKRADLSSRSPDPSIHTSWNMTSAQNKHLQQNIAWCQHLGAHLQDVV